MATIEEVYEKVTELHQAGAPDEDIDKFIVAEGFKFEDIQNYKPRPKDLDVTTGADYNVRLLQDWHQTLNPNLQQFKNFIPMHEKMQRLITLSLENQLVIPCYSIQREWTWET